LIDESPDVLCADNYFTGRRANLAQRGAQARHDAAISFESRNAGFFVQL
jgi:hypothetical protein